MKTTGNCSSFHRRLCHTNSTTYHHYWGRSMPMPRTSTFHVFAISVLVLLLSTIIGSDIMAQDYRQYKKPRPSKKVVIEYMAHLQGTDDTEWVTQPGTCGTTGQGRRLEGFAIQHSEASQDQIALRYKVYLQDVGEQGWTYMPDFAGTRRQKRRLEAFWIEVTDKSDEYSVYYRAHLAGKSWTPWMKDGKMCGTKNEQRAVEAIEIMVVDR